MSRKKIPGITRLPSGRYRARSRRKGYPIDSKVFDSVADAAEWKSAADAKKRHGIYRDAKEAENTTLRDALRAYLAEVLRARKAKPRLMNATTFDKYWSIVRATKQWTLSR